MEELKTKYVGKYIAENKIKDIAVLGETTSLGSVIFDVTYESGDKQIIPEKGLVISVSDQKRDSSKMLEVLLSTISDECIKLIGEYDLPSYLFDRIGQKIELELKNHIQRAASIVWFGTPDKYAPGFDSSGIVTLLMADQLNKKFPPK